MRWAWLRRRSRSGGRFAHRGAGRRRGGQGRGLAFALHQSKRARAPHARRAVLTLQDELVLSGLVEGDVAVAGREGGDHGGLSRIARSGLADGSPSALAPAVVRAHQTWELLPALRRGVRGAGARHLELSALLHDGHRAGGRTAASGSRSASSSPVADVPRALHGARRPATRQRRLLCGRGARRAHGEARKQGHREQSNPLSLAGGRVPSERSSLAELAVTVHA